MKGLSSLVYAPSLQCYYTTPALSLGHTQPIEFGFHLKALCTTFCTADLSIHSLNRQPQRKAPASGMTHDPALKFCFLEIPDSSSQALGFHYVVESSLG